MSNPPQQFLATFLQYGAYFGDQQYQAINLFEVAHNDIEPNSEFSRLWRRGDWRKSLIHAPASLLEAIRFVLRTSEAFRPRCQTEYGFDPWFLDPWMPEVLEAVRGEIKRRRSEG